MVALCSVHSSARSLQISSSASRKRSDDSHDGFLSFERENPAPEGLFKKEKLWPVGRWLLNLGLAAGVVAVASGLWAEKQIGHTAPGHELIISIAT